MLLSGSAFYCFYSSSQVCNFINAIESAGFLVKQELIWNKNTFALSRNDYHYKHEPIIYGWKGGSSHKWCSDRKQTTVIDCPKPTKNDIHPTMKPVVLYRYLISNNTNKNDNVLDLFGGSGTAIIACEQMNRNAFVMEYDPKYVDVIIDRWENLTGNKAIKL